MAPRAAQTVGDVGSMSAAWISLIFPSAISSEAADVEIIAAAAGAEFQRPAGAVLAIFEPEAGRLQPRQQRRVEPLHLVGDELVRQLHHRQRHAGIEDVADAIGGPSPR